MHEHSKESLHVVIPNYHLSFKGNSPIIASIGKVLQDDLARLKRSRHIGLLQDESSDSSKKEVLLLYVTYFLKSH